MPVEIFATNLSPLESLVKFLKENLNYNFHSIGQLLNRDERTIWYTYKKASDKRVIFDIKKPTILIPVDTFSDRKFSVLESLTLYLKELNYEVKDIAILLNKKTASMWTVYRRAIKKQGGSNV